MGRLAALYFDLKEQTHTEILLLLYKACIGTNCQHLFHCKGYGDENRKYVVKTGFEKWSQYLKEHKINTILKLCKLKKECYNI